LSKNHSETGHNSFLFLIVTTILGLKPNFDQERDGMLVTIATVFIGVLAGVAVGIQSPLAGSMSQRIGEGFHGIYWPLAYLGSFCI
jgi:hypothetical protein